MKKFGKTAREMIEYEEMLLNTRERTIPPDQLPFDLTTELGAVMTAEEVSSGVYSISTAKGVEYFIVTEDAPAISEQARAYGQQSAKYPSLLIYQQYAVGSGWRIISFELLRYQIRHRLPVVEQADSLYCTALYGMEEHPEYFGTFPVPAVTPRGYTVRHKAIINGVYWLETDRCEEMLAICYPIWQADITIPEQRLGEQLEYDRIRGVDETFGYLFFSKKSSCIPLYELLLVNQSMKDSGVIDEPALLNAICELYPEYSAILNDEKAKYKGVSLIEVAPGAGTEYIRF